MSGRRSKKAPLVAVATQGVTTGVLVDAVLVVVDWSAAATPPSAAMARRRPRDEVWGCMFEMV